MKILALLLTVSISFASAQNVEIYRTDNHNIGFGKSSVCKGNQFMDFVINGPLVGSDMMPVGGYIDNGVVKKPWTDPAVGGGNFAVRNAILGYDYAGDVFMVPLADSALLRSRSIKWAIQNGPILVHQHRNVCGTSQSKYVRSGIGYRNDGVIVLIISKEPMTFHDFAELFLKEGCVNALYLDGGDVFAGFSNNNTSVGMNPDALKLQCFNN